MLRCAQKEQANCLTMREISLDARRHMCSLRDEGIKLTDTEFAILCFLLQNRGRVVSFQELSDAVWQDEVYISRSGCLAVHVNHIREKLHDHKPFATVKTAWGKGYWVE